MIIFRHIWPAQQKQLEGEIGMYKLLSLALAAAAFAALPQPAGAKITWTFYETSCSPGSNGISCPAPAGYAGPGVPSITFPYPLATLSLPDTTSSGTALWYGLPGPGPTYIGDSFTFIAGIAGGNLSQTFTGTVCGGPACPVAFDLTWNEIPGSLIASIFLLTQGNEIAINNTGPIGPSGDWVGSDNMLGGCLDALCRMTGYWQSDLPEPASAGLLLTGLLVTWAVWQPSRALAGRRPPRLGFLTHVAVRQSPGN